MLCRHIVAIPNPHPYPLLTTTTVTSSAGSAPPVNAASAPQIAPIVSSALPPWLAGDHVAQPVLAEHLALAVQRLGHAVGVEDQRIAGRQVEPLPAPGSPQPAAQVRIQRLQIDQPRTQGLRLSRGQPR